MARSRFRPANSRRLGAVTSTGIAAERATDVSRDLHVARSCIGLGQSESSSETRWRFRWHFRFGLLPVDHVFWLGPQPCGRAKLSDGGTIDGQLATASLSLGVGRG